jgi:hypothetical protein
MAQYFASGIPGGGFRPFFASREVEVANRDIAHKPIRQRITPGPAPSSQQARGIGNNLIHFLHIF